MKAFKIVMKILVALAAVAGIVYVVATYGEQIVAWARRVLDKLQCYFGYCDCDCCDCDCEEVEIFDDAAEAQDFEG